MILGLRFIINLAQPVGERIETIQVNGQPLENERAYKIACTNFISKGGDGYKALTRQDEVIFRQSAQSLNQVVEAYLQRHPTIAPTVDGRITILQQ